MHCDAHIAAELLFHFNDTRMYASKKLLELTETQSGRFCYPKHRRLVQSVLAHIRSSGTGSSKKRSERVTKYADVVRIFWNRPYNSYRRNLGKSSVKNQKNTSKNKFIVIDLIIKYSG